MPKVNVGDHVRIIETGEKGRVVWRSREASIADSDKGAWLDVNVGRGLGVANLAHARESEVEVLDGAR